MTTTTIYTIKKLRDLAKEQSYKFACLYDSKDKKINNYNTLQVAISKQFDVIENRLKSPALLDGIYFVGLCQKYGRGQIIDKFPVMKGSGDTIAALTHYTVMSEQQKSTENVLSYESALAMQKDIARLENENHFLNANNVLMQEKINTLTAELKDCEDTLSQYEVNGVPVKSGLAEMGDRAGNFLKEVAPMLTPLADRFFDYKEKLISLEEKRIDAGVNKKTKNVKEEKLKVGSKAFLDYIRELHSENDNEEELNKCLDILEANYPQQYDDICTELDLFEEEEEEEQND